MNQGNCQDFDTCVQTQLGDLQQPIDPDSLYANRFYDKEVANNRCYEGFDGNNNTMFQRFLLFLISVVAVILVVVACFSMCQKKGYMNEYNRTYGYNGANPEIVYLGIPTEKMVSSTYAKY